MVRKDDIIHMPPAPARQAWLTAVVPADARTFQVDDPRLAATLATAGAEIVETNADVEVQEAGPRPSTARVAILRIEGKSPTSPIRTMRALQRAWTSSMLRVRFLRAVPWRPRRVSIVWRPCLRPAQARRPSRPAFGAPRSLPPVSQPARACLPAASGTATSGTAICLSTATG